MRLTPEQIEDFHRESWLFLPELFTPDISTTRPSA